MTASQNEPRQGRATNAFGSCSDHADAVINVMIATPQLLLERRIIEISTEAWRGIEIPESVAGAVRSLSEPHATPIVLSAHLRPMGWVCSEPDADAAMVELFIDDQVVRQLITLGVPPQLQIRTWIAQI